MDVPDQGEEEGDEGGVEGAGRAAAGGGGGGTFGLRSADSHLVVRCLFDAFVKCEEVVPFGRDPRGEEVAGAFAQRRERGGGGEGGVGFRVVEAGRDGVEELGGDGEEGVGVRG